MRLDRKNTDNKCKAVKRKNRRRRSDKINRASSQAG